MSVFQPTDCSDLISQYYPWTRNCKMWYSLLALEKIGDDEILARVTADGSSPWFAGHFPDNPILPGIAQLHMVAEVIAFSRQQPMHIQRLNRVKFKKLVRPGDVMVVHATAGDENHYSFRISHEDQDVCSGMMSLAVNTTIPEFP